MLSNQLGQDFPPADRLILPHSPPKQNPISSHSKAPGLFDVFLHSG
jgi:hypothetical protein